MAADTVRSLLGLPQRTHQGIGINELQPGVERIEWYPLSGISLVIDSGGLVRAINFRGNGGDPDWIPSTERIIGNLRLTDRFASFVAGLGTPVTVDTADARFVATWRIAGIALTGEFWLQDTDEEGLVRGSPGRIDMRHYPAHSLAWLKAQPAIK